MITITVIITVVIALLATLAFVAFKLMRNDFIRHFIKSLLVTFLIEFIILVLFSSRASQIFYARIIVDAAFSLHRLSDLNTDDKYDIHWLEVLVKGAAQKAYSFLVKEGKADNVIMRKASEMGLHT